MNDEPHKLEYSAKPDPTYGPTAFHHVIDAVTLAIVAFDVWLIGYGVVYGWGMGAGGAVTLLLLSIVILLCLITIRAVDRSCWTVLFYLNTVVTGLLLLLFLGLVFLTVLSNPYF